MDKRGPRSGRDIRVTNQKIKPSASNNWQVYNRFYSGGVNLAAFALVLGFTHVADEFAFIGINQ